jgi:hypothetical protein
MRAVRLGAVRLGEERYDQIRCVNTNVSSLVGKEVKSERTMKRI